MGITLTVYDERAPGRPIGSLTLANLPSPITLRDLIRTRVREEVALANSLPVGALRMLVQPVEQRRLDWREHAAVTEQAFFENGFLVVVDDRRIEDLDEELDLDADSDVRFLRPPRFVGD